MKAALERKELGARLTLIAGIVFLGIAAAVSTVVGSGLESQTRASDADALPTSNPSDGFPEIDWDMWLSINPAVVGWVTVPNTGIDQPIVQAPKDEPGFYLEHSVSKEPDAIGCAFLDAECADLGLASRNCVVFGHHWSQGRMFTDFAKYSDEQFASEHSEILLQTPDCKKRLAVACVEVARGTDDTKVTRFESAQEFECWLDQRYEASNVKLSNRLGGNNLPERIYTFCTCSYTTYDNERTLVYAVEDSPR